jgi:ABC-type Fe3+ transport system substrate-binding protein
MFIEQTRRMSMHNAFRRAVTLLLACAVAGAPLAQAAEPDAARLAAAQREGHLLWYTTLLEEAWAPIRQGFQQRYPGIDVQVVRAAAPLNAKKIIDEHAAGAVKADLFDGSSTAGLLMARALVQPYISPSASTIPAQFKDPDGHWTSTVLYYMTMGYNPAMIKPADAPKTWDDLLDPKWQGKMAWSAELAPTSAQGLVGNVLLSMGDEAGMAYLRRLSAQRIANIQINPRRIVSMVARQDYPIGLQVMVHHTVMAQREGQNVNWVRMEPLTATGNAIGIVKGGPHPNAARLMVDFILSESGQKLLKAADHIPSNRIVDSGFPELDDVKVRFISPVQAAQNNDKWNAVLKALFVEPVQQFK